VSTADARPDTAGGRPAVAVVDIGSNSIKMLAAARGRTTALAELAQRTEETRIGTGITGRPPRLAEAAMDRAAASVRRLLAHASPFAPRATKIVATSAVRDAANRAAFAGKILAATGHPLTVLTGGEEARTIGRGIACDPGLRAPPAFYAFDLGGGSLEILAFAEGRVRRAASLPLGCVRLTEHCVPDPRHALPEAAKERIRTHVRDALGPAAFAFDLPAPAFGVFTGGTVTTLRLLAAAAAGVGLDSTSATIPLAEVDALAERFASMDLGQRLAVPGMPARRADVLPAALFTLGEVARAAGVTALRHSFYNLRYGIADEMLEAWGG
jgi:exopolyphosphatase/guanosine-5'-triphosphate,3'-diphosphate pyrophosphatase